MPVHSGNAANQTISPESGRFSAGRLPRRLELGKLGASLGRSGVDAIKRECLVPLLYGIATQAHLGLSCRRRSQP